jgi:hypothetical protein
MTEACASRKEHTIRAYYENFMIILAISVFLAVVNPMGFIAVASPSTPFSKQATCDPIGRITDGTSENFNRGQVVCAGDVIVEPNEVVFLCFTNAALIPISGRDVVISQETCSESVAASAPPARACDRTGLSRLLCLIPKGPEEQFQLLEPDVVSSNPRPLISWQPVEAAESYTVSVLGPDLTWERVIGAESTDLAYPVQEASMAAGNAYEVLVTANRQQPVTASRIVNVQNGGAENLSLRLEETEPRQTVKEIVLQER